MSNDARIIFHIDMNAFFAAVEELDHPEYRGQPIIVGGDPDGRGVVSTASYAARQWGIHSGMPVARARALCPQVIILPVNMERYRAVSSQLMAYFRTLTPLVEPFSIDEAYLDMTGLAQSWEHAIAWAKTIKRDIKARFGLTTSVGIGPNKLLAKMASGMEKPDGLVVLRYQDLPAKLWPLPVDELFGIGLATAVTLRKIGLATIGDLAQAPVDFLTRRFGSYGAKLVAWANGRDTDLVLSERERPESIGRETTFRTDLHDPDALFGHLLWLSDAVCTRLRQERMLCRTVTVKLRFADFRTITRAHTLINATDVTGQIHRAAKRLLQEHWQGSPVRLLGVTLSGLQEKSAGRQMAFFPDPQDKQDIRLDKALDNVRERCGSDAIWRARYLLTGSRGKGEDK